MRATRVERRTRELAKAADLNCTCGGDAHDPRWHEEWCELEQGWIDCREQAEDEQATQ